MSAASTTERPNFARTINGPARPPRQRLDEVVDPRLYAGEPTEDAERAFCKGLMDRIRAFELDPVNFFKVGRRR